MKKLLLLLLFPTLAFAADVNNTVYGGAMLMQWMGGGTATEHTFSINESGDRFGCVINPIEDATITQCCHRRAGRTGAPGLMQVGIQALDSNGYGDGTFVQSTTYAPASSFGTDCNSFTGVSVTRGTRYACVWQASGTYDGSNYVDVVDYLNNSNQPQSSYTYTKNGAGAAAKTGGFPSCWSKSASRTYGQPYTAANTGSYVTSGDTGAMRFKLASSSCSTATITAFFVCGRLNTTTSMTLSLFSGGATTDTTTLKTSTYVSAADSNNFGGHACHIYPFTGTPPTVTCGSTYRFGITAPGANAVEFKYIDVPANADGEAFGTGMSEWYYSQRTAGNWTDTNTRFPLAFPILGDMTGGSSGGLRGQNSNSGGAQ
jgi:hypothetical protein